MRLTSLSLQQFRSYGSLELEFENGNVHVLVGPNGAGKTNILESISMLGLTKSCQGTDDVDLMHWGTEFYRIRGEAKTDNDEPVVVEVASQLTPRKKKAFFKNDVNISAGELVGTIPVVYFLPQDLSLFTGSPAGRRTWLDQLLCQVSPGYLRELSTYQKLVKQRNVLLKRVNAGNADRTELPLWDQQVAAPAARITLKRLEMVEVLNCSLAEELKRLSEEWNDAQLVYNRKTTTRSEEELTNELVEKLTENHERDIILQSTSVGPHREDWQLITSERDITTFASRGQQRTAVLALLLLQVSYLELQRGEKPIILLDDVFSELDDAHQSALLQSLADHQVIITTTHVPQELHGATVWEVEAGKVQSTAVAA